MSREQFEAVAEWLIHGGEFIEVENLFEVETIETDGLEIAEAA